MILDQYIGGDVQRISPEAPVPVLDMCWKEYRLGGAGNVVNNLRSLGANVRLVTCIGQDGAGDRLVSLMQKQDVETKYVVRDSSFSTIKKIRIVAKNQQVIRVDDERHCSVPETFYDYVVNSSNDLFKDIHAVIISDYGKGLLTSDFTTYIIGLAREKLIPIIVDPKGVQWEKYYGSTACTPNLNELSQVAGFKISPFDEEKIKTFATLVCNKFNFEFILVTRSENGMSLVTKDGIKQDFPVIKKEVIDVSGAGDTVISVFTLCYASNMLKEDCCKISNIAASIVVSKFGTTPVTIAELNAYADTTDSKIIDTDGRLKNILNALREEGKKIVFTNGCYDILHVGHITTFEQARALGDVLIVGVNSDNSIRELKGKNRPIINQNDRLKVISSLKMVDYVVMFDSLTPIDLIRMIKPDVLVKGMDYQDKVIVGEEIVKSAGGVVELVPLVEGKSTSSIIMKILDMYQR